MTIVTGAKGFIGSNLVERLKTLGIDPLRVDFYDYPENGVIDADDFLKWLEKHAGEVDFIFHMGANSDTMADKKVVWNYNFHYTSILFKLCTLANIPIVYASSAATYGNGELGFSDDHSDQAAINHMKKLNPLNWYGLSKHVTDLGILEGVYGPDFWAGLKFFNVYGYGEAHKKTMASMVYHGYNQAKLADKIRLFKASSQRDFVYIDDVINVCIWMMQNRPKPGLYNVGTGQANSFVKLAECVFDSMDLPRNIEFFNMPYKLREQYQFFTKADCSKLHKVGYPTNTFRKLSEGVELYIKKLQYEDSNKPILTKA